VDVWGSPRIFDWDDRSEEKITIPVCDGPAKSLELIVPHFASE